MSGNGIARFLNVAPEEQATRKRLGVLPSQDLGAAQERMAKWRETLQPRDVIEEHLTAMIYSQSQDLDRASRAHEARREIYVMEAVECAASLERDEAIELARRLFFNPRGPAHLYGCERPYMGKGPRISDSAGRDLNNEPARLVKRMEGTAAGCRSLLEYWTRLRQHLEPDSYWQSYEKFVAIRLMGKQPLDALADPEVSLVFEASHALHPQGSHPFVELRGELTARGMADFLTEWRRRRPPLIEARDAVKGRQALLALVEPAISRLSAMAEEHEQRPVARKPFELAYYDSPDGQRYQRYLLERGQSLSRTLADFQKYRARWRKGKG
jgi:hypothetical protein